MSDKRLVVTLPTEELIRDAAIPEEIAEVVLWPMDAPAPRKSLDMVAVPWPGGYEALAHLHGVDVDLVQWPGIGYEKAPPLLPAGLRFANSTGLSEPATAELALALVLAAQRELPVFQGAQEGARWDKVIERTFPRGLAYQRVVLLGLGGVGKAIAARLAPFEVELTVLARRARSEDGVQVGTIDGLCEVVPTADIVIAALPGDVSTNGLIDREVLAGLRDGALVVNVGRGNAVDTDALLAELASGRLRAALDVTDPEPLPGDHALWRAPNLIITPHTGGITQALPRRRADLIRNQVERLARGDEPLNVVLTT